MKIETEWMKAAVYGANDGIITTFAVVAAVAGAGLAPSIIIIMGIANMLADGVSMGMGDYLGEMSQQRMRRRLGKSYNTDGLWKTGVITFGAFVVAGALPLLPYVVAYLGVPFSPDVQFPVSVTTTLCALFGVGASRTLLTGGRWWRNGAEMLVLGGLAGGVAFGLGAWVEGLVG